MYVRKKMCIFLHTLPAFGALGCWSRKFHNLDFPTFEMLHAKNSNNWLCSFKDAKYVKLLTQNGQRTTQVDGQRPIAIGHLSDSGDLKPVSDNEADTDAAIKG